MSKKQPIYSDLASSEMRSYGICDWRLTLDPEKPYWGPVAKEIHEVPPGYEPTLEKALEFYPQDDHEGRPLILNTMESAIAEGSSWSVVCRFTTAKKRCIWCARREMSLLMLPDAQSD